MSDFAWCKTCGEYDWLNKHRCPPLFKVKRKEDDDEYARNVYARDAERAAEKFCARHDSDFDYQIIENKEADIEVWPIDDPGKRVSLHIVAEMVAEYWVDPR